MDDGRVLGLAVRIVTEPGNMCVPEIRDLLAARLLQPYPTGHADRWVSWRCRDQARSSCYHQRTRLSRDHALVS